MKKILLLMAFGFASLLSTDLLSQPTSVVRQTAPVPAAPRSVNAPSNLDQYYYQMRNCCLGYETMECCNYPQPCCWYLQPCYYPQLGFCCPDQNYVATSPSRYRPYGQTKWQYWRRGCCCWKCY